MKNLFLLLFLFSFFCLSAQTKPLKIRAEGDTTDYSYIIKGEFKKTIKPDKKYRIEISGVNSAHTSLKINAESKEIYTPAPKVVETVLPNMTGSMLLINGMLKIFRIAQRSKK